MTFLFDIGNVLLHVDFDESLARLFPSPPADFPRRMQQVMSTKDELESGRIGSAPFIDRTIGILGFEGPREAFVDAWCRVFEPVGPMWDCVEKLSSADHRLILFSNTNDLHMDHALARYPVFRHFPEAVFSHRVGAMKPDDPIYQYAVDTYDLDPAATVYIDDLPENIDGGRRFGWHCWQYDHNAHDAFLRWLEGRLETPAP